MSSQEKQIERSFGKLEDRLSYIGGLFEIIIIILSFFLNSYNIYRYELLVSEKTYTDREKAKEKDFNFCMYIKYTIFQWINFFSCVLDWQDCIKISQAREQANQQMDVQKMLRRINHNEDISDLVVTENQQKVLYLKNPKSLHQHRKRRKYFEYYDHLVQDQIPRTMVTVEKQKKTIQVIEVESNINLQENFSPAKKTINFIEDNPAKVMNEDIDQLDEEDKQIEDELFSAYEQVQPKFKEQIEGQIPISIQQRLKVREKRKGNIPYQKITIKN